eukprot:GSChrysophyteH1.ASY1.ANO1.1156.1 assembled CDS
MYSEIPKGLNLVKILSIALKQIPQNIPPNEIIRDAFSYIQQYRLLLLAENDKDLKELVISNGLFVGVEPLVSLAGAHIGGSISNLIYAYKNVKRVILSDMRLTDECSLKPLTTIPFLEYLNLDSNDFETKIEGLNFLTKLKSLSLRHLLKWKGSSLHKDGQESTMSLFLTLKAFPVLKELHIEGSFKSGMITIATAKWLQSLDLCTGVYGKYLDPSRSVFQTGFSLEQFRLGGATDKEIKGGYYISVLMADGASEAEISALGLSSFKFTNGNIKSAVEDWCDHSTKAESTHGHISNWDVSNVTNMNELFKGKVRFNDDISGWNVSNVTKMEHMFHGAKAFNQPLNNWNVSQVTDMGLMFNGARAFNQPLDNWNVSKVTDMGGMFSLASAFNQPLNNWNVSQVTDMGLMFNGARAFNQPSDNWNVSKVTDMRSMFSLATAFNQPLNNWNVSQVTRMSFMFYGATSFNQPLNNWNVSQVTDMLSMFKGARAFNQPLNNWKVSQVPNMRSMHR